MGALLSLGQERRWRDFMVSRIDAPADARILDVASGTGLVARELVARTGARIVALDQSSEMLAAGAWRNEELGISDRIEQVIGRAEDLPFEDASFDALTFTYLLRYVEDPAAVLRELARVVRPGGPIASLEFCVPRDPLLRAGWRMFTRVGLPLLGATASPAWRDTGRFLGPNIEWFNHDYPLRRQAELWHRAGIRGLGGRVFTGGAGVVTWGTKA